MSKYVKIKFGSEHLTINKENLDQAKEDHITLFKDELVINGRDQEKVSDLAYDKQRETIKSIRDTEKSVLEQLLRGALNADKKITVLNEISDSIEIIENCEKDHVILPKTDINRMNKSYEKLQEIPGGWLKLKELFKQLENPEEVEIEEKIKEPKNAS